jgi:hypothetical protein
MNDFMSTAKRPQSVSTAAEAWAGKRIALSITGRKYLNGRSFTEHFKIPLCAIPRPNDIKEAVFRSIEAVDPQTDIPADLVERVTFRIVEDIAP